MADDETDGDRHVPLEDLDPLPLAEALSILGEETRARIVTELGRARSPDPTSPDALGFAELMERTDVADSGRFNYHLDRLVDAFVRRTDEGYELRLPGQLVYRAIVAGTLTERRTVEPFPVGDCPDCDGELTAAYHPDHVLTVECTDCETLFDAIHLPARALDGRSERELLDAAYERRHHEVAAMRRGVCPACGAVVERDLAPTASPSYGEAPAEEMAGLDVYAVLSCTACDARLVGHPTNVALTTPAVVGFFADHGRDVARARWWDGPIAAARRELAVHGEDPASVATAFEIDGDRLRVVLDDGLQVVESTRRGG